MFQPKTSRIATLFPAPIAWESGISFPEQAGMETRAALRQSTFLRQYAPSLRTPCSGAFSLNLRHAAN
jgi:hypothetical protein